MHKNIIYNEEALMALQQGAKKLAKAVKVTFGPKGRNVFIESNGHPLSTKDGITIVRNIELADYYSKDFGTELIKTLVTNKTKNVLDVLAVKIPNSVSDAIPEDIALTCNTKLAGAQNGIPVENLQIKELGTTQKVVSNNARTIISGSDRKNESLDKTINKLALQLIGEPLLTERNKISERISRLRGEIAHVYVGASTELEREEKKQRFKNAEESYPEKLDKILGEHTTGLGYNVLTRQFEDFFESGIIDPVKNLKISLQDSVAFVSLLIRTKCAITEHREVSGSEN